MLGAMSNRSKEATMHSIFAINRLFTIVLISGLIAGLLAPSTIGTASAATAAPPFFVHYYLWWDSNHWHSKLGSQYPYAQRPLPLPATLAADQCTVTSTYSGNSLLDIPASPLSLYAQDDIAVFDNHIQTAAQAGVSGFTVAWAGNGATNQTAASTLYNRRLDSLVQRATAYNATHATKFYLMIGYQSLNNARTPRSDSWIRNDWNYLVRTYGANPVFRIPQYGQKPAVIMLNSRKFAIATIASIVAPFRTSFLLIGDEHGLNDWNRGVSQYFDGNSWYWASENPYTNPGATKTLSQLSATLHAQGKLWFAPLNGGFNRKNFGMNGICTPRNNGDTLTKVYAVNKPSNPDGWTYISWNEFVENTYIEPSTRYGRLYLDRLKSIIANP
jgi:hypothetical protein